MEDKSSKSLRKKDANKPFSCVHFVMLYINAYHFLVTTKIFGNFDILFYFQIAFSYEWIYLMSSLIPDAVLKKIVQKIKIFTK